MLYLNIVCVIVFIVTDEIDGDYLPGGMVTLATSNKDEVRLLQELGFQLIDISQPVTTPGGNDKEVKVGELAGRTQLDLDHSWSVQVSACCSEWAVIRI